jgi:hypothetical protein
MNGFYENTLRKGRAFLAGLNDVTLASVSWNLRRADRTERADQVCTPCCGVHDSHFDCLMLIVLG